MKDFVRISEYWWVNSWSLVSWWVLDWEVPFVHPPATGHTVWKLSKWESFSSVPCETCRGVIQVSASGAHFIARAWYGGLSWLPWAVVGVSILPGLGDLPQFRQDHRRHSPCSGWLPQALKGSFEVCRPGIESWLCQLLLCVLGQVAKNLPQFFSYVKWDYYKQQNKK